MVKKHSIMLRTNKRREVRPKKFRFVQRRRPVKRPSSTRSLTAIRTALQSIVAITSYDVPDDMSNARLYAKPPKFACCGHGIIIESEVVVGTESEVVVGTESEVIVGTESEVAIGSKSEVAVGTKSEVAGGDATYLITILAPANLFKRTNGIEPQEVEFNVRVRDGELYKGEVVYCDFHYNIAAVRIKSKSSFKPASLMALNDVSPINNDVQSHGGNSFQIGRHSNLFKVRTGTEIMVLNNSYNTQFSFRVACGVFSPSRRLYYDCKELYWVFRTGNINSGAVINCSGEVLGILFDEEAFLPSNFISRWWDHCKSTGKFCRPWVGVEVLNLAEARSNILEQFKNAFSEVGTGVIVTKVEKDTPAFRVGIKREDVIVKCNGKLVKSKMEFFESMWDNAGNLVELTVLRSSDGQELNMSMSIEEATSTNFYKWMRPVIIPYE